MRFAFYSISSIIIGFLLGLIYNVVNGITATTNETVIYRTSDCKYTEFDKIFNTLSNTKNDIDELKAGIQKLSEIIGKHVSSNVSFSAITENKTTYNTNGNQENTLTGGLKIDDNKLHEIINNLNSDSPSSRMDSIVVLSKIGTPETQQELAMLILDNSEDMGLRITAINNIDWRYNSNDLEMIFSSSNDDDIKSALLDTAITTDFEGVEQNKLSQRLYDYFDNENDEIKIRSLRFLFKNNPQYAKALMDTHPIEGFPEDMRGFVKVIYDAATYDTTLEPAQ